MMHYNIQHTTTSNVVPLTGFHILKDYITLEYKMRNHVIDMLASPDWDNLEGIKAYYASFAKMTMEVLDEEWQGSLASTSQALNHRRFKIIGAIHESLRRLQEIQEGKPSLSKDQGVKEGALIVNFPTVEAVPCEVNASHKASPGLSIRWVPRFF